MEAPVIALMTDFGDDDFFVASLKGTILKINPKARLIDITHRVPSFNSKSASFILSSCYKYFPEKTIFLVVVDPGVGSSRQILAVETKRYFFIAPDNGVLTLVLEEEDVQQMRAVTNMKYFLPEISHTFEGRDKMAPVAAALSSGEACEELGPELNQYEKIELEKPTIKDKEIIGQIIYKDKFGNLIPNISEKQIEEFKRVFEFKKRDKEIKLCLQIKGVEIPRYEESYISVEKGEFLFLIGSLGLVEIACREDSAADGLKADAGDLVKVGVRLEKLE